MSRLLCSLMPAHAAVIAALEHSNQAPSLCASASLSEEPAFSAELILGKYIVINQGGREYAILFHRDLQHSEVISPKVGTPVAAGFYQFFPPSTVTVNGESTTLDLSSRPQDAAIIKRHLLFL